MAWGGVAVNPQNHFPPLTISVGEFCTVSYQEVLPLLVSSQHTDLITNIQTLQLWVRLQWKRRGFTEILAGKASTNLDEARWNYHQSGRISASISTEMTKRWNGRSCALAKERAWQPSQMPGHSSNKQQNWGKLSGTDWSQKKKNKIQSSRQSLNHNYSKIVCKLLHIVWSVLWYGFC